MIKIQYPKKMKVKDQWANHFKIVQSSIYIVLLCFAITLYCAYSISKEKVKLQDQKIKSLENIMVKQTNLIIDLEYKINSFEYLKKGHAEIETKYGSVLEHNLIDKETKK